MGCPSGFATNRNLVDIGFTLARHISTHAQHTLSSTIKANQTQVWDAKPWVHADVDRQAAEVT
jgi:hypothetical protein